MVQTAKVTLVTVFAVFELEERFVKDLKALGVRNYSLGKVDGRGVHGLRTAGLVDAASMRLEMLVSRELADKILERVAGGYADQPVVTYMHEVEAVPSERFPQV